MASINASVSSLQRTGVQPISNPDLPFQHETASVGLFAFVHEIYERLISRSKDATFGAPGSERVSPRPKLCSKTAKVGMKVQRKTNKGLKSKGVKEEQEATRSHMLRKRKEESSKEVTKKKKDLKECGCFTQLTTPK